MTDAGRLFDVESVPLAYNQDVLGAIGLELGALDACSDYVRVTISAGSTYFEAGHGFTSVWTDHHVNALANPADWQVATAPRTCFEGFVICAIRASNGEFILHLMPNITDVDMSVAVRLNDITKVEVYPPNASKTMAMYQNALADDKYLGLTAEQLAPYIEQHWPEPTVVYAK